MEAYRQKVVLYIVKSEAEDPCLNAKNESSLMNAFIVTAPIRVVYLYRPLCGKSVLKIPLKNLTILLIFLFYLDWTESIDEWIICYMLGWLQCTGRPDAARVFWTAGWPETNSRSVLRCIQLDVNFCHFWRGTTALSRRRSFWSLLYFIIEQSSEAWKLSRDTDTSAWGQSCFLWVARSLYPVADF